MIGEAPGLALMIGQLEVDRFFHTYENRTAPFSICTPMVTRTGRLTREHLTQLFREAGWDAEYIEGGIAGRGLYVAR